MRLNVYLKSQGIVTGPRSKRSNTSHSRLDVNLKFLTNRPQFRGNEKFLWFGNGAHENFLLGKISTKFARKLTADKKKHIRGMTAALWKNVVVVKLMEKATVEIKKKTYLNGVKVAYILDINQKHKRRGSDYKTTDAKSLEAFVKKAIEFGYFRQAETYKAAEGLTEFVLIGQRKEPPYEIFILDVRMYPQEVRYAVQELEFLLYFYQNYGNCLKGGIDRRPTSDGAVTAFITQVESMKIVNVVKRKKRWLRK